LARDRRPSSAKDAAAIKEAVVPVNRIGVGSKDSGFSTPTARNEYIIGRTVKGDPNSADVKAVETALRDFAKEHNQSRAWTFDAFVKDAENWAQQERPRYELGRFRDLVELSRPWYAQHILDGIHRVRTFIERGESNEAAVEALRVGSMYTEAFIKFRWEPLALASSRGGKKGAARKHDAASRAKWTGKKKDWLQTAIEAIDREPQLLSNISALSRIVARKCQSEQNTVRPFLSRHRANLEFGNLHITTCGAESIQIWASRTSLKQRCACGAEITATLQPDASI
jgi:hypothetical protein